MHLIVIATLLVGSAPSGRQIMDQVMEARRLPATEMVSTLTIYNEKGQQRVRRIAAVAKLFDGGATEKRLLRFLAPADVKGTGLLTFDYAAKDDDMWLYLPALRKSRRIISSEKSKNFMGSEFTYADMNIPNLDQFSYSVLRQEPFDGVDCWVVEDKPASEDVAEEYGYSRRVAWVGQSDKVLRKVVYYDLNGELHKELLSTEVKLVDPGAGKHRAMRMEMVNKQNGRRSSMVVDKLELAPSVKDDYFSTRYLERD